MLKDNDVRLPGARREALRRRAEAEGIEVSEAVLASLRESA
jgi:(2R)-3-sulfolactate dehydrogenase (NADP+)